MLSLLRLLQMIALLAVSTRRAGALAVGRRVGGRLAVARLGVARLATSSGAEGGDPKPRPRLKLSRIKTGDSGSSSSSSSSKKEPAKKNFVTVKLGTDEDIQNAEMEDRLLEARQWVSKRLSDDDAEMLNRALGIEAEVLSAMDAEDGEGALFGGSDKSKASAKGKGKKSKEKALKDIVASGDTRAAAAVKGFLEMNPYICSGCGTTFQSRTSDAPGFLPPEKLQEHRKKSLLIREKQEAIRILELAGMEVDSPAAEELLRDANVSAEVIAGVRALGRGDVRPASVFKDDSVEEEEQEQEQEQVGRRISSVKSMIAAASSSKNEVDEDEDEDEDPLDGLEIDLEELLASSSISAKSGSTDGADGVAAGLLNIISKAKPSSSSGRLPRSLSPLESPQGFVNDLDDEISSGGRARVSPMASSSSSVPAGRKGGRGVAAVLGESAFPTSGAPSSAGDAEAMASLVEPVCICQRCFRLQQYGQVEQSLRPGWSSHELLTPARFEELLGAVRESDAVVLCLVDLFDLQGSLLENLKSIAGHNPIVIAANKYDLLPRDASANRLVSWVHSEVKRVCDLSSPKEAEEERYEEIKARGYRRVSDDRESEAGVLRRSNVHLISSQSGLGVDKLLRSVMAMAADNGNKVYVMGAANVGKSSFINRMLDDSYGGKGGAGASKKKKRSDVPTATVSNLPGTTLDFLKIRLPNGVTMIDTPGLLTPGQLTAKLSPDELRQVVPSKPINAVTLRLSEGKCVLVGGIASVEMVEVRPSSLCVMVACVWRP